jgi:16S rRNA (adenine1518-N6/adenine1519-N6)-dimethyltransferase
MLRSSVRDVPGALEALEKLGIDNTRRAETISVPEWVALARELSALG